MMNKDSIKVIALYLPQFHPTQDNDMWWGKGFTEWTSVAKAKKLYRNHYQPHIPADLGFYDLRLRDVREKQVQLARRAGVSAFCYYHYWFGNGKQELERPFKEVIREGKPDFPICLCWANESWYSKMWSKDGSIEKKLLVEQLYPGEEDNRRHFLSLLEAFKDNRYMRIGGKLVFMIYKPLSFPLCREFMDQWNHLAAENGLNGFHFIGHCQNPKSMQDINEILDIGFDAVNVLRLDNYKFGAYNFFNRTKNFVFHRILNRPYINDYKRVINHLVGAEDLKENVYPSLVPNWDHTPRSGRGGYLYENCEPVLFEHHCKMVIDEVKDKSEPNRIIFLKSWNEWGEGNYMEPDLRYGYGYIDALKRALSGVE